MNEVKLRNELKCFHGISRYYKHLFPGKSPILLTDGCKYVRDEFNANWLFDDILMYQDEPLLKKVYFQIWELQRLKKDLTWLLTCKEDIFKYCKVDSILVIDKTGQLQRLDCPFEVLVI